MTVLPLTTLSQLEAVIGKTSSTNDRQLERAIVRASDLADTFTRRNLRARTYGSDSGPPAEVQDGNGESWIAPHQWPVLAISSIYDDTARDFGSGTLKASTEYYIDDRRHLIHLEPDAAHGTIFRVGKKNIQLSYTGGYGLFQVLDGVNDKLDFEEASEVEITATVAEGEYTAANLATAIKTALDAADGNGSTYTITYDYFTGKFKLASNRSGGDTFKILWSGGTNAETSIGRTLGFDVSADDADAASHTADYSSLGIPGDLEDAVIMICQRIISRSPGFGSMRFDIVKEIRGGTMGGTMEYDTGEIPKLALEILKRYKKMFV